MIFPEILSIQSPDLEPPLLPPDPFDCAVKFETMVGPAGGTGGETFRFVVITPVHLARSAEITWGRGRLVMNSFDWTAVVQGVATLLAQCARPTWGEVVTALDRELLWVSGEPEQ